MGEKLKATNAYCLRNVYMFMIKMVKDQKGKGQRTVKKNNVMFITNAAVLL